MTVELTGPQRRFLKALAHHLEPLVQVGKNGVTDALAHAADQALEAHELVKVRFVGHKEERRALSEELVQRTGSSLVGMVGMVATLYRRQEDDERRRIVLPG
jgi:RNA-binding protein